jgi:predicted RecB family nuclease
MRRSGTTLRLSATDLSAHLACIHRTQLERRAAAGELERIVRRDPLLEVLEHRGRSHEADYLTHLRAARIDVLELTDDASGEGAAQRTRKAMGEGAAAIAQATLQDGRWYGRADLLRRVEQPSALGPWSYEVIDTKLASETRAGTVLQLCLYSDLVAGIQGLVPEAMYVVSPGRFDAPERLRTHDFVAVYRWVRAQLERALAVDAEATLPTYPEPVPHCDVCAW